MLGDMIGAIGEAVEKVTGPLSRKIKSNQGFDVSLEPNELDQIKDGEEFYKNAVKEQKPMLRIWYKSIAYYMGLQWLDWNESMNWLAEPSAPSWRVRMVCNLIMPTIRNRVAKILRSDPNFRCIPANDSKESRDGAKVGDRVLESKYFEDDFQRKLYNLAMWFSTCGSAFLWSTWDGTLGKSWSDVCPTGPDGLPLIDPATGEPQTQTYYEGDVVHEVTGPFETLLEPQAPEDFNEHRRIMKIKVRGVQYLEEKYGKKVPTEDIGGETLFQTRVGSLISGANIGGPATATTKVKDSAIVKEFFELPSKKYPNGRHFCYCNGVMLVDLEDLDYWYRGQRCLPCAKFDDITIPGRTWAMSIIEQIAPINITFNKMSSQVIENCNLLSRPKVLSPQGSLDEDQFTSEPGEVVEYTPIGGMKPEAWKPPEMPQYFFQMKDSLPGLIDTISGNYEASKGKLPRRATSGKAIDLLQEADETNMSPVVKNMGSSLERVMSITLCTIGKKYRESRLIKKMGKAHEYEIFTFKGTDLMDCDAVRVEMGYALSRAARTNLAMEMAKNGMIPKDAVKKIIEQGQFNIAFDEDSDQVRYAEIENFGMAKGVLYPVGSHEPHDAHINVHLEYLNGEEGSKLPDQIKQVINTHIDTHKTVKQAQLAGVANLGGALPPPGASPSNSPGGEQGGV